MMTERSDTTVTYLIEIAFSDPDDRDDALDAIEGLMGAIGQIGTISTRSEVNDDWSKPSLSHD